MSRLIDADALMERVKKIYTEMGVDTHGIWNKQLAEILHTLDVEDVREFLHKILGTITQAPTIDVVRCKECKYWEESQYYQEFMVCTYVMGATFTRQHDDFCSRGERKESE